MRDYKERLVEEKTEVSNRLEKLNLFLTKYYKNPEGIVLDCPLSLLEEQRDVMYHYDDILRQRISYTLKGEK